MVLMLDYVTFILMSPPLVIIMLRIINYVMLYLVIVSKGSPLSWAGSKTINDFIK